MKRQIRIKASSVIVVADLYNTKTAETIWQSLPLSSNVNTWGDEICFRIPVEIELESARKVFNF